jgi:hypothetical protein
MTGGLFIKAVDRGDSRRHRGLFKIPGGAAVVRRPEQCPFAPEHRIASHTSHCRWLCMRPDHFAARFVLVWGCGEQAATSLPLLPSEG